MMPFGGPPPGGPPSLMGGPPDGMFPRGGPGGPGGDLSSGEAPPEMANVRNSVDMDIEQEQPQQKPRRERNRESRDVVHIQTTIKSC